MQYKKIYSELNLHFVFAAKFRRKLFRIEGAEQCFVAAAEKELGKMNVRLLDAQCKEEAVHLYASLPPDISPSKVLTSVKRATSAALKEQILGLGEHASVWTWDALVVTDATYNQETEQAFINRQKKRTKQTKPLDEA